MAPLPANNTDRWFLDYVTGSHAGATEHTMQLRLGSNAGIDGASAAFLAILNGVGASNFYLGWKAIRMRYQAAGTNFSIPTSPGASLAAFAGTGTGAGTDVIEAIEATVQGRSLSTGRRVDISIYGIKTTVTNFRVTATVAPWSTLVAALNGLVNPALAVDGSIVTWYAYVNFNYNSYWERRKRSV